MGGLFPQGEGEVWSETEEVFTLDASDFDDYVVGFSFVVSLHNRLEVGVNLDFYEEGLAAEYRDFTDQDGFPIVHETDFALVPLTADARFFPAGRYRMRPGGRRVQRPAFYVGGGLGVTFWEYEEFGEFLDFTFDPPEIFGAHFVDDGAAFEVHALAGVELPVGRRTALLFEGRHAWAEETLGGDFAGLGELDLGGTSVYGGISFRF
jgi:hypothetical protein